MFIQYKEGMTKKELLENIQHNTKTLSDVKQAYIKAQSKFCSALDKIALQEGRTANQKPNSQGYFTN